jgi:hypothetical protein
MTAILAQILDMIDASTDPSQMGPGEALEVLEQLHTEIQCRIDGLKDDMRNAGQDWGE